MKAALLLGHVGLDQLVYRGRITITVPHPERSYRYLQNSWRAVQASGDSGWMRLFRNARRFVD